MLRDALVIKQMCHARSHGFNSHRRIPSKRDGQPHWLSLTNIEGGRIEVSRQRCSMIPFSTQDKRRKTPPEWAW